MKDHLGEWYILAVEMFEKLLISCLLGIPTGYLTSILLFNFHGGPFTNYKKWVEDYRTDDDERWRLNLFDHMRNIISFGRIYDKTKPDYWQIRQNNIAEIFSCPYCLSFWVAIPFMLVLFDQYFLIYWFTIAAVSTILNKNYV